MKHMRCKKLDIVVPKASPEVVDEEEDLMGLSSGYITRARGTMPKQGSNAPWRVQMDYISDAFALWWDGVKDSSNVLEFQKLSIEAGMLQSSLPQQPRTSKL